MTDQFDARSRPKTGHSPWGWRVLVLMLLAGLLGGAFGSWAGPAPMSTAPLSLDADSGDAALAARVRRAIGDDRGYKSLSVAEVTKTGAVYAGLGAPDESHPSVTATTRYPLGSITKTFNGMLLADAIQRGEVRADQRIETLLPELRGCEAGSVTLAELASHRAGVPPMLTEESLRGLAIKLTLSDPYSADVPRLLEEVRGYKLSHRGEVRYSNNGAALLGHGLARAAGEPSWEALVTHRVFQPLGMTNTVIAATDDRLPADRVQEWNNNAHQMQTWTSQAHAPAGSSTWTTAEDIARYAQAILNSTAPGMGALDPQWDAPRESRIGLHWFTKQVNGRQITWHNGGVAGGRSMLTLDREAGRAVIVLGNSDRSVDGLGLELVSGQDFPNRSELNVVGLATLVVWLTMCALFVRSALRDPTRRMVLNRGLDAAGLTLFADRLGPWDLIPGWIFGAGVGVLLATAVYATMRARRLPWTDRHSPRGWIGLGASAVVLALLIGLVAFG